LDEGGISESLETNGEKQHQEPPAPKMALLGINPTQPDPKRRFESQIRSKQIRIMIISEV
jgi:hypothetical protein